MKKLSFILLSVLTFYCCKQELSSDTAIKVLSKTYLVTGPEKEGDGTLFYEVLAAELNGKDTVYLDAITSANKIKGCLDQNLGILPQNTEGNKFSHIEKAAFFRYEYETLKEQVRLETYIKRNEKKVNANGEVQVYIKAKVWIVKKY